MNWDLTETVKANMFTLFDIVEDKVIFNGEYCQWCDHMFSSESFDHMVFISYQGQHGHLIMHAYHKKCLHNRLTMFAKFEPDLTDCQ